MARKTPAWQRLVREGLVADRREAERWILAGDVRAGGQPVRTAGEPVPDDAPVHVKGRDARYVSKGGLKLEGALADFAVEVAGRVCMDAGASTGGFTDCLAQNGASRVYAVDVGYGQLAGSLRANPAVVNLERTNLGDDTLLALDPPPTLGTVDLSYLSLRKAAPLFARIQRGKGDLLCLVKPLFEIDDAVARRTGIIAEGAYVPLLVSLAGALAQDGFAVCGITNSPVTGNNGTLEFFLHLSLAGGKALSPAQRAHAADRAVQAALALPLYHKG